MTSNVIWFLCLKAQIKLKFSRIRLLYIHLILKPVERPVLTSFLKVFLILKYQKDRDRGPVFIQFSPVRSPVFYRSLRLDLETLIDAYVRKIKKKKYMYQYVQICAHKVIRFLSTWLATEVTYKHDKTYWLDHIDH